MILINKLISPVLSPRNSRKPASFTVLDLFLLPLLCQGLKTSFLDAVAGHPMLGCNLSELGNCLAAILNGDGTAGMKDAPGRWV